jgi:hypothetical protein
MAVSWIKPAISNAKIPDSVLPVFIFGPELSLN